MATSNQPFATDRHRRLPPPLPKERERSESGQNVAGGGKEVPPPLFAGTSVSNNNIKWKL